jgi:hypothetical protein
VSGLLDVGVEFRVSRAPVPIVWLDTSILIKRAQIRAGQALNADDHRRVNWLHDKIYRLVRSRQLTCPEANQPSEVWRNGEALFDALNEYSLGLWTSHPRLVQDHQERQAMRRYALGSNIVDLSYTDLFPSDPIAKLTENLSQRIFISIVETPSCELISELRTSHSAIHRDWEALRVRLVEQRVSYQSQVQVELTGEMSAVFELAEAYFEKSARGEETSERNFFAICDWFE